MKFNSLAVRGGDRLAHQWVTVELDATDGAAIVHLSASVEVPAQPNETIENLSQRVKAALIAVLSAG